MTSPPIRPARRRSPSRSSSPPLRLPPRRARRRPPRPRRVVVPPIGAVPAGAGRPGPRPGGLSTPAGGSDRWPRRRWPPAPAGPVPPTPATAPYQPARPGGGGGVPDPQPTIVTPAAGLTRHPRVGARKLAPRSTAATSPSGSPGGAASSRAPCSPASTSCATAHTFTLTVREGSAGPGRRLHRDRDAEGHDRGPRRARARHLHDQAPSATPPAVEVTVA